MMGTGQNSNGDTAQVLHWPGQVLCAEDLRYHLHGQRELVVSYRVVITPLAAEELRARGVQVRRQEAASLTPQPGQGWVVVQEKPDGVIANVLRSLARDGAPLAEWPAEPRPSGSEDMSARWAKMVAANLGQGQYGGVAAFCQDAALVCCVANKVAGVRAAAVVNAAQASRARLKFAANLLAVEMPGRTFFEVKQILRAALQNKGSCPENVAKLLQELDGHAHR